MREITDMNEVKARLLGILDYIDDYCTKNGLVYYLAFGSLLGAVRHNGFIPWDDDLDIMMPRKDYEKFIYNFSSENYKVISLRNDRNYIYPFAKVYDRRTQIIENITARQNFGIYVDIFPIDGLPKEELCVKHFKKLERYQNMLKSKYAPLSRKRVFYKQLLMPLYKLVLKAFSFEYLIRKINHQARKYDCSSNKYVGITVWGYYRQKYRKEWLDIPVKHKFEGREYNVPRRNEKILKVIYGDYMKLPPENERVYTHGYKAFVEDDV